MKNIILFLFVFFSGMLFSQNYYDQQWKQIEDNYEKGVFKSNLPIILDIQNHAMKDNNTVQLIKSLKAEFSILNTTRDDTQNDSVSQFFMKLNTFQDDLKGKDQLLYEVLLTEFFREYYQNNSWKINQKTNIDNQDFSQIETWSKIDFKNLLNRKYEELQKQNNALKKIKIANYKAIFDDVQDIDYFPTLSDWNSFNYIDFLKNGSLFTPNELKDNNSKIITIYDQLITENSGNAKLYFQHQKINYSCDFAKCKDRLNSLEKLVNDNTIKGDYKIKIISDIVEILIEKEEYNTALRWISKGKSIDPASNFINNITNQENRITAPTLSLYYENETQTNKPIHIVAETKNTNRFSIKIYEVKDDISGFLKHIYNSYQFPFSSVKKTLVRTENYQIQNPGDFKKYSTSFEIKPLPSGIYLGEYSVDGNKGDTFYFLVTENTVIYQDKKDYSNDNLMKIVSNESGKPIVSEELEFTEYINDKKINTYAGRSDEMGIFSFPESFNDNYYRTYLIKEKGTQNYNFLQIYGTRKNRSENSFSDEEMAQIFLDRKIYRPGQTVYYKVVTTEVDGKTRKQKVLENIKLNIVLYDANNEEVSTSQLTTNKFGSVNGSFVLPKGKLNGNFHISVKNESKDLNIEQTEYFRVEEYKRPKFEVTFEPVKDEYKYGQTIELKGKAIMFSGVPLGNATVSYEIKKQNIRWRYFWWYPRENDNENSILGDVKTNDKGEFTIKIELKKDETLEGIQIDNYSINASVTDINGETQSAGTHLKVASVSHYLKADEIESAFTDEEVQLNVKTLNYNDQDLKKTYQLKLSKLEEPKHIYRKNFQNKIQDKPQISENDFYQKFPHDRFSINDLKEKWKAEKTVKQGTASSEKELNLGKLPAGTYKLELYNIEGRDTIRSKQYFSIWEKNRLSGQHPFLEVIRPKGDFKRGSKAKIYVYSAIPDAMLNIFVQNGNGKTITETRSFQNGILKYEIDIPTDEKIGWIKIQFQLVTFNDIQTQSVDLKISETQKPLRIETVTFRDKIQPGQKEKWTVKILGDDQEKISAEVLASMYDRSLDQFSANRWNWQTFSFPVRFNDYSVHQNLKSEHYSERYDYLRNREIQTPSFNWMDGGIYGRRMYSYALRGKVAGVTLEASAPVADSAASADLEEVVVTGYTDKKVSNITGANIQENENQEDLDKIPVRENLNETAFFYPTLYTDAEGNVNFEFTSPEALTQWKMMFLAHTQDARGSVLSKEVITQKDFSITPNYPRFLREGDQLQLQTKISSLLNQKLTGTAQLQVLDAFTNEDISSKFNLKDLQKNFSLNENGNIVANWNIKVPKNISCIILKIVAKAGNYSDGEQKAIAILPNRMLVTDALPIFVKEGQTKTFVLENLKNSDSSTLSNVSNTLELTTNPIWEIMFALPSLKDDQSHSADVVFNKWFADVLASEIFKANPKMKTVFDEYQNKGLLISNLEKNQELKQLLLEETPWVLESKNETEQMQKLARIFDANTMRNSINDDWTELLKLQNPDGGFSWYSGYPSSYYVSLYILKNLGRINEWLNENISDYQSEDQKKMVKKLIGYVDNEVNQYWTDLDEKFYWNNFVLDYLDTRHYWEQEYPLQDKGLKLKNRVIEKAKKADIQDFTFFGLHRAALLFDNYGLKEVSNKLMTYLKETSTNTETQGVYWKQNLDDWGWYNTKTVNHAGALEAFEKLTPNDTSFIEEMKIWLVTQKEVNSWGTSRETAEVIFSILNAGKSWTSAESDKAEISWGGKPLNPQTKATGYMKQTVTADQTDKNLATVTVKKDGPGIVQGGLFWQYYEDLDKIKFSESYISITKELYRKVKTENGEQLVKISENTPLKIGDKVTVRMILNTDRNMEFIHLKDMRAAGFEPVDILSGYQWKNALEYYQVTKDASTNFYIQTMPKGKYIFEYDYLCNAAGTFSNGITTLQNYYAPQMNAHSQGSKITIEE